MDEASATAGIYIPFDEDGNKLSDGMMYLSRLGGGGFGETYYAYFSKRRCLEGGVPDGVVKAFTGGNDRGAQELCRNSEFHRLENVRSNAKEIRDLSPCPYSRGEARIHPKSYPAFLMSYVEGVSFEDVLCGMAHGNTPSARERLAYATALAEPLRALHAACARRRDGALTGRYMHGDIKPNNLVVQYGRLDGARAYGEQGSKEVSPWGLRARDETQRFQIEKCCLLDFGTLREATDVVYPELTPPWELDVRQIGLYAVYAAPERLNSDEVEMSTGARVVYPGCLSVSPRSDVWSYGILLLRMCFPDLYDRHYDNTCSRNGVLAIGSLPSIKNAIEASAEVTRSKLESACHSIPCTHGSNKRYLDVIDCLFAHVIARCLAPMPEDRPSMSQIASLLRRAWDLLKAGEFGALDANELRCLVDDKLGRKRIGHVDTPSFVETSIEKTESVDVVDVWGGVSYKGGFSSDDDAGQSAPQTASVLVKEFPDGDFDGSIPPRSRLRTVSLSVLSCLSSLAAPLVFWSILLAGETVHVDTMPLAVGFIAVLVGIAAVVLSKGATAVFALVSLALATAICVIFPDAAMTLPASLGASNAQYHIAERLDAEGDTDAAFEHYVKSADAGNPFANYALGEYYEYGSGPAEQNNEKAIEYYERASELGYLPE